MRTSLELRKKNVLDVIKIFTYNEKITKNDVANKTGLTIVTINTVINELIEKRILIEDGIADSIGGRPASLYKLNASKHYMVGVNIGLDEISIQISNFGLELLYKNKMAVENGEQFDDILKKLKNMLSAAMEKSNIHREDILGMGVTVPGLIDKEKGVIELLPNMLGWKNIQIRQIFEEEFGMKVFVEKDTYASVLCLRNQFNFELKSAVLLIIRGGIGGGILLDGRIYKGENGIAGELGHISLEMNGPVCKCGNTGCLEVYASDYAIVSEVINEIKQGGKSIIESLSKRENHKIDIDLVIEAAKQKDELCNKVLSRASAYVATAVSNIIKAYDPSYVVIESKWIKEADGMFDSMVNTCKAKSTLHQKNNVKIVLNQEKDLCLTGAVLLVQDYFLNSINDNQLLN